MSPFFEIGQLVTFLFFVCFLIFFPLLSLIEKIMYQLYIEELMPVATHVYTDNWVNVKIYFNIYKERLFINIYICFTFYYIYILKLISL